MFEVQFPYLKELCKDIRIKFGYKHRMINCIEELSELQKALCKRLRKLEGGYSNIENIEFIQRDKVIEEIADVYITIEEVKYCNTISDEEIFIIMKKKLDRGVF